MLTSLEGPMLSPFWVLSSMGMAGQIVDLNHSPASLTLWQRGRVSILVMVRSSK